MQSNQISLDILVNGKPIREYRHEGKSFVESREGTEYSLRVKNNTSDRILTVISVDGINIVSGKPTTDNPNETGYVLGPWESQEFKGYRVDGDTVAQFKFVKREKSYATERGEGQGNGVIAIRAYSDKSAANDKHLKEMMERIKELERRRPEKEYIWVGPARLWYWEDYWYGPSRPTVWYGGYVQHTSTTDAEIKIFGSMSPEFTCSTGPISTTAVLGASHARAESRCTNEVTSFTVQSAVNPFDAGTSWGAAVKDSVKEVEFEVGRLLDEVVVYYAFVEGLKALGIDVTRTKAVTFPEPFKKTYCPRPSGWTS